MSEKLNPELLQKFRDGVDALASEIFEVDEYGGLPVSWRIIDRTRYRISNYWPVRHPEDVHRIEDLDQIMRDLMSNVSTATGELEVFLRTRPFDEERIQKENASLVDQLSGHPELLTEVSELSDTLREIVELRLKIEQLERVRQNQTRKLMAKDAMDGSAYARHICDALGIDPSEVESKSFGILLDDLLKRANLLDTAIENRKKRTDSKKHE